MDGKGREGTYNFFSRRLGGGSQGQGTGHTGQLPPATPLAPPMNRGLLLDHPVLVFTEAGMLTLAVAPEQR